MNVKQRKGLQRFKKSCMVALLAAGLFPRVKSIKQLEGVFFTYGRFYANVRRCGSPIQGIGFHRYVLRWRRESGRYNQKSKNQYVSNHTSEVICYSMSLIAF